MPQALEALPISLAKRDSTLSDASLDYMMDESDDVFDRTSLVRTNSSQSSNSSLSSVDSAGTKSILKKKRRSLTQRDCDREQRKRVSFSNQVERRVIIQDSVFDHRYMLKV
ncbi:unnamed protein product [Ambrosiozyma monospora]|uniref:Unnamed protein product n=1 Tax=Ambrosiozyma monospora TaxID=43982 RepID=A0ACB5TP95_AMBMO|nr:unnamed protein product [Ambrosiozyma monospora]